VHKGAELAKSAAIHIYLHAEALEFNARTLRNDMHITLFHSPVNSLVSIAFFLVMICLAVQRLDRQGHRIRGLIGAFWRVRVRGLEFPKQD